MWQVEVLDDIWGDERCQEVTAGSVDVYVDVDTGVGLEFIQCIVQRLWEFIVISVGYVESWYYVDGVFVTGFNYVFWVYK